MDILKGELGNIFGIKVISSPYATTREQFKFPRSKKKRIRKKWAKNYKYNNEYFKDVPGIWIVGRNIIGHPTIIYKLTNFTL